MIYYILLRKRMVTSIIQLLVVVAINLFSSGCVTIQQPAEMMFTSGASITSISSNASLRYKSPERNVSGSGLLMYQKPDDMRMVVLSPFGSVLQEVFVSGEQVTIIDSGNGVAFSGIYNDLPAKGDFSAWRHFHWLIDIDPPDSSRRTAVIQRINRFGETEEAVFENGLLISKKTVKDGYVKYGKYTGLQGVAVPLEIEYETAAKEQFSIQMDDPEINVAITGGTFTPDLSKYRIYPLSSLK